MDRAIKPIIRVITVMPDFPINLFNQGATLSMTKADRAVKKTATPFTM
jgi:hypothetical protein